MKIKQEVIDILEQSRIEENRLYLPDIQLERKLYISVDKVLKMAGGKWNRSKKAHLFSEDVGDTIDNIVLLGEICDINKELQYFPTPRSVVNTLIDMADIQEGESVLEPSAGTGAIAFALAKRGYTPTVVEIHPPFALLLSDTFDTIERDFIEWSKQIDYKYDKIVANPPFTRQQDVDHVISMIDICCGRVVSVMSASVLFRDNKKTVDFRDHIEHLGGRFIDLPENSFKESGTMVNTCILVVDIKPS